MISVLEFLEKMKKYSRSELAMMPMAVWVRDTHTKLPEVVQILIKDQMILDLKHDKSGEIMQCCVFTVENLDAENLDIFSSGKNCSENEIKKLIR